MKFEYKKSLGQNFIKDDSVVSKIIVYANIDKDTLVIEIGPGSGSLTKKILDNAKFALLYEIDKRLDKILNKELNDYNNYELIFKDFLDVDINDDLSKYEYKKLYIVANLPYYITTPIINKIINDNINPDKIVIMLQKEVADRLVAKPNTSDYGYITVILNYYYECHKLFDVSRNSFIPKPKVDSAVIELKRKNDKLDIKNKIIFNKLVKDSFKYKRKNIKNNLIDYDLNKIEKILNKYSLDLNARAENLPIEIFVEIANNL